VWCCSNQQQQQPEQQQHVDYREKEASEVAALNGFVVITATSSILIIHLQQRPTLLRAPLDLYSVLDTGCCLVVTSSG
jgi:hypothetical protein